MFDNWGWLVGTYWFVPEANLTAPVFESEGDPIWLSDQTVWHIVGYANGYFWGDTAVRMVPPAKSDDETNPSAQRLTASITPEGNIHITFIPVDSADDAEEPIGIGNMRWRDGAWMAQMQMSTPFGSNRRVLHWAYMVQCKPEDPAWKQLPGTNQSLPDFMQAAGFTTTT